MEKSTRLHAEAMARAMPVRPKHVVWDPIFPQQDAMLEGITGVGNAQAILERAYLENRGAHVSPGIKFQVLYWSGSYGMIGAFDRDGRQIGFGQAIWNQDPRRREARNGIMTYDTAYVVIPQFEGQGYTTSMMKLLEEHIAVNNMGKGAGFFYEIQAETPERKQAALKLIRKTGAILLSDGVHWLRHLVKSAYFKSGVPGLVQLPSEQIVEKVFYNKGQ